MYKIYLSQDDLGRMDGVLFNPTIPLAFKKRDCWICNMFRESLQQDDVGWYLPDTVIEDDGILLHLEQVIGREFDNEIWHKIFG